MERAVVGADGLRWQKIRILRRRPVPFSEHFSVANLFELGPPESRFRFLCGVLQETHPPQLVGGGGSRSPKCGGMDARNQAGVDF